MLCLIQTTCLYLAAMCPNDCSGNGKCSDNAGSWACDCNQDWLGPDCSIYGEQTKQQQHEVQQQRRVVTGQAFLQSVQLQSMSSDYM